VKGSNQSNIMEGFSIAGSTKKNQICQTLLIMKIRNKVLTIANRQSLKAIKSLCLEDTDDVTTPQCAALTRGQPHQTQDCNRHPHICTAAHKFTVNICYLKRSSDGGWKRLSGTIYK